MRGSTFRLGALPCRLRGGSTFQVRVLCCRLRVPPRRNEELNSKLWIFLLGPGTYLLRWLFYPQDWGSIFLVGGSPFPVETYICQVAATFRRRRFTTIIWQIIAATHVFADPLRRQWAIKSQPCKSARTASRTSNLEGRTPQLGK